MATLEQKLAISRQLDNTIQAWERLNLECETLFTAAVHREIAYNMTLQLRALSRLIDESGVIK